MPLSEIHSFPITSEFSPEAKDALLTHIKGLQRELQAKDIQLTDLQDQLKRVKEDLAAAHTSTPH